jgi:magnesium transporter
VIKPIEFELTKEFLDRFRSAITQQENSFIQESLEGVNPADITALLFELDTIESKFVFDLLHADVAADILIELDEETRNNFLENFTSEQIAVFVDEMDSDDGADILQDMPLKKREQIISGMVNENRALHIQDLLRYDEDVAGGLMAKELIKANINWNVLQCIDEIRKQAENVEKIFSVYVVDDDDRLLGKVSLKRIILANDKVKIADIYDQDVMSIETYIEEKEVAQIMQKYDLEALPVVNARGKLAGRITVDDILDVITELAEEERQLMSGIVTDVEEDDSVWALSKARLPWLIIGMVGGLLAAQITDLFSADIQLIAGLALFIPLIMATGGNVGIQSSSIVVQSLATKNAFSDRMTKRLFKVLVVAVVNGLVLALLVFGAVLLIFHDQSLSYTVSIALFAVVLLASFMGTVTPLVLDNFGINPALASGPFITTANDLLGLAVYFSVAHLLYSV